MKPTIHRSHRSSLALHITPDGEVIVKVPFFMPNFLINQFLAEKEEWIQKSLTKITQRKRPHKTYKEGESFFYLGKEYILRFTDAIHIVFQDDTVLFPKALLFRAQKELTAWYTTQAKKLITERVAYHAEKMHVKHNGLLFSDTKSKWGTCFHDNSLQFNWRLIMTPIMVIDYVIIHELSHITHKNHSDAFWRRVRQFTPAYRQHRKWLNDHAHLLEI